MSVIDKFMPMLMEKEEEGCVTPILIHGPTTFIYIKHNNLFRILSLGVVWAERSITAAVLFPKFLNASCLL